MKKIPCLFERDGQTYKAINKRIVDITGATPTVKWDGTATMVKDGQLFVRYALKPEKKAPPEFIHVDTREGNGKLLGWIPADRNNPAHKHHFSVPHPQTDGTYELCGPKFQTNPYLLDEHRFILHGADELENVPTDFDGLREFLSGANVEGIVWWRDGEPIAKLKCSDFGIPWGPAKTKT